MRQNTLLGYTKATLAAFSLIALTQSCQKSSDLQAPATEAASISQTHLSDLKQSISAATGAPVSDIDYSAASQTFTVSKDAKLSLSTAEDYYNRPATQGTQRTEQRVNAYIVSNTRVRNISIYCNSSVPS